jgi:hypothetical protein
MAKPKETLTAKPKAKRSEMLTAKPRAKRSEMLTETDLPKAILRAKHLVRPKVKHLVRLTDLPMLKPPLQT